MKIIFANLLVLLFGLIAVEKASATTFCPGIPKQRYLTTAHDMEWCAGGVLWESIINSTAGACAAGLEGKQRFVSNEMQYCDGTNWISMNSCGLDTNTPCDGPGRQIKTSGNNSIYCDGTNWKYIAGPSGCVVSLTCDEFANSGSATCVKAGCYYYNGTCNTSTQVISCGDYTTQPTCDSHPVECVWNVNTCIVNNGSI